MVISAAVRKDELFHLGGILGDHQTLLIVCANAPSPVDLILEEPVKPHCDSRLRYQFLPR